MSDLSDCSRPAAHHTRGVFLMLTSVACFTVNVLLVRLLGEMHAANIWLVSCARFVVGFAMILAVYHADFQPLHLFRRRKLIERGLVGGLGVYVTYLTVVKLGAGRAIFINNTYVILAPLLAALLLREPLRRVVIVGSVTAVAGLGLLTNVFSSAAHPSIYDLVAFGSALLSAYVVVTIRQLHATEHTSTIFGAQCVYGLLICAVPAFLTFEPLALPAWSVIFIASLFAGAGQLTMTRAFRDLSVAEGSLLQILVPIGIGAGGVAFFGEHFTVHELVGAALIIAGTAFTSLRR